MFLESAAAQTHSFYDNTSSVDYSSANVSTTESSSSETMDEKKFKEYPVARLKKSEFVKNGKFLCNNADCQKAFDKNRERK
jgi:hypothetical protein